MKKKIYLSIKWKTIITIIVIILFSLICSIIEIPWWSGLVNHFGIILATMIVIGLAFLPGIMICTTIVGIILDKPRRRKIIESELEDITILIAAYNEEKSIYETLQSLSKQDYSKKIIIKAIDNNSNDRTAMEIYRAIIDFPNLDINYLFCKKQGKFAALNKGLSETNTRFVITIDADTWLYKDSIKKIVNAIIQESKNKKIGAIAGTVLVRNSRVNLLTKMQEWEYFLSIASIKRMQGLFQSILVAQGAFSIYNTEVLKEIGGWRDSIGEDIVLTWEILSKGYKTYYEDCAIAFTNVPTEMKIFRRQRARWARGMIEGFRHFSFKTCENPYAKALIFMDLFLFYIDFSITFFFIPGIIIALLFHVFWIVGPMTIILLPLNMVLFVIMFFKEKNKVFKLFGLKIRKHYLSFFVFLFTYSLILSPTCVWGYLQEFTRSKRKWK